MSVVVSLCLCAFETLSDPTGCKACERILTGRSGTKGGGTSPSKPTNATCLYAAAAAAAAGGINRQLRHSAIPLSAKPMKAFWRDTHTAAHPPLSPLGIQFLTQENAHAPLIDALTPVLLLLLLSGI
jgi:hypothetical protein